MKNQTNGYSVHSVISKKFQTLEFEGKFKDAYGCPGFMFSIMFWGLPSNGKTSGAIQLAKYLTKFGKVAYNSLEEGLSHTMQMTMKHNNMHEVGGKFILLNRMPIPEMMEKMAAHKSPKFWFVDSVQYTGMTLKQYKDLKALAKEKKKGIALISHAKGKEPKGSLADFIRYDVDIKVPVRGYRAYPEGRLNGGGQYFDIWPEKSAEIHAEIN